MWRPSLFLKGLNVETKATLAAAFKVFYSQSTVLNHQESGRSIDNILLMPHCSYNSSNLKHENCFQMHQNFCYYYLLKQPPLLLLYLLKQFCLCHFLTYNVTKLLSILSGLLNETKNALNWSHVVCLWLHLICICHLFSATNYFETAAVIESKI